MPTIKKTSVKVPVKYALGKQGKSDFAITKNGKKTDLSTIDIKHAKNVIKTLNKNQPDLSKKIPKENSKMDKKMDMGKKEMKVEKKEYKKTPAKKK